MPIRKRRFMLWILLVAIFSCLTFQLATLFQLTTAAAAAARDDEIHHLSASHHLHTRIHCVGDNFLESSSWQSKSCHYQNLCYDKSGSGGTWTIRASKSQLQLEEYNLSSSSTRLQQQYVSTIGLHPRWIRNKEYRWSPDILPAAAAAAAAAATINENMVVQSNRTVVVVMSIPKFESELGLFMDSLMPLYNLIEIFDLTKQQRKSSSSISVHVLNADQVNVDTRFFDHGLDMMGYSRFDPPPNNNLCVSHVAAGIGMLTVTGLSRRGQVADDYEPIKLRNMGRGSFFERFRNHIMNNYDDHDDNNNSLLDDEKMTKTIRLALPTSHALAVNLLQELQTLLPPSWAVHDEAPSNFLSMEASILSDAASTYVWIAHANNDTYTWPALFLPRNSHLVLLYDPNVRIKNKQDNNDQRPVRKDINLWNQMSHIKVHWLSISHGPVTLAELIKGIIITTDDDNGAHEETKSTPDGSFNGLDVLLKQYKMSKSHCLGENWMRYAEVYRSCHMQHLCFDTKQRKFVLDMPFQKDQQDHLSALDSVSTWPDNATTKVMMGQPIQYPRKDVWFPTLRTGQEQQSAGGYYYALDPKVVWLPYHPFQPNVNNPGHLLWDYWLPLYTLLDMFQLVQEEKSLLLTNLDPACVSNARDLTCYNLTTKFLPLLGVNPTTFASTFNSKLALKDATTPSSSLVCAEHGAAGIGMLTDHGISKHGQLLKDYTLIKNVGRGPMFRNFRNFMLANMGIVSRVRPFKITFSILSSKNPSRRRNFERQIALTKQLYPPNNKDGIVVQSVVMAELTLQEQLVLVQESAVFISVIGGATSTAMFLQEYTSLVLYFNDIDDFAKGSEVPMANRMDWDFWNNASYLRLHWLSILNMDEERDLKAFSLLLQSEVDSVLLDSAKMKN